MSKDIKKILLVEDNFVNREVALAMLECMDCDITQAENGLEALEEVVKQNFDLILMDCQMPEMDGIEATKKITEMKRENKLQDMPIIALTAHATREECINAGMCDFISKPVKMAVLKEILDKWIIKD